MRIVIIIRVFSKRNLKSRLIQQKVLTHFRIQMVEVELGNIILNNTIKNIMIIKKIIILLKGKKELDSILSIHKDFRKVRMIIKNRI
jgi:hypothetical protein